MVENSPLCYRVKPLIQYGYRNIQVQSGTGAELGGQFGTRTELQYLFGMGAKFLGSEDTGPSNLLVKVKYVRRIIPCN